MEFADLNRVDLPPALIAQVAYKIALYYDATVNEAMPFDTLTQLLYEAEYLSRLRAGPLFAPLILEVIAEVIKSMSVAERLLCGIDV